MESLPTMEFTSPDALNDFNFYAEQILNKVEVFPAEVIQEADYEEYTHKITALKLWLDKIKERIQRSDWTMDRDVVEWMMHVEMGMARVLFWVRGSMSREEANFFAQLQKIIHQETKRAFAYRSRSATE